MKKILFMIHDLGHGGAEKVLVNLVNNMNHEKYDITVMALFGGGVNEQFLDAKIHYKTVFKKSFPGNSRFMQMFTPEQLHKKYIKERYDIEVAYLEGPAVRIISGCQDFQTMLVSWVHCTMHSEREFAIGFRSYNEAKKCFSRFHKNVFVSQEVMSAFRKYCSISNGYVIHNTNESEKILSKATEAIEPGLFNKNEIKLIGVGKIEAVKGFERLAEVHEKLICDGFPVHTYILGTGSKKDELQSYLEQHNLTDSFTFLGYQTNPYKFVKNSDIFVCSSYSEGFSTATTEALIVGTPVVTTDVSGMREMLGENNEWGIITENDTVSLYKGIRNLLLNPEMIKHYRKQAGIRGKDFQTDKTVRAVEQMLGEYEGNF